MSDDIKLQNMILNTFWALTQRRYLGNFSHLTHIFSMEKGNLIGNLDFRLDSSERNL